MLGCPVSEPTKTVVVSSWSGYDGGSVEGIVMLSTLPQATRFLLMANVVLFILGQEWLLGNRLFVPFALWPASNHFWAIAAGAQFQVWQLVTYAFLHGNLTHLLFNLMALWMFGAPVEQVWGARRFTTYYLVCVTGAGVCQLLVSWLFGSQMPVIGASGGVFGLLLAYGLLFPTQQVFLLFPPIPMKAQTLVIVYGVAELLLGVTGWQPGIAHFAHLGGMLFGWLLICYWRGRPPFGRARQRW